MDQRGGVQHLKTARSGHRGARVAADDIATRKAQSGPEALAAGEQRIAHGFEDSCRVADRNGLLQLCCDKSRFGNQIG